MENLFLKFDKICRTCLAENEDMQSVNNYIKTAHNSVIVITEMLFLCTQLQISNGDNLPSQICLKCICKIRDGYFFRQHCEQNEAKLRKILSENCNVEYISVDRSDCKENNDNFLLSYEDDSNSANERAVINIENYVMEDSENKKVDSSDVLHNEVTNEETQDKLDEIVTIKNQIKENNDVIAGNSESRMMERNRKEIRIAPKPVTPYIVESSVAVLNGPNTTEEFEKAYYTENAVGTVFNIEECKICGCGFLNETILRTHLKNKHNLNAIPMDTKYACNICNAEFAIYDQLNEHNLLEHLKVFGFQCGICNIAFTNRMLLNRHKKNEHFKTVDNLTCNICDKKFETVKGLGVHKSFHNITKTQEENVSCKICDRTFNVPANLTYHMKYHKANVCHYCNNGFCNMVDLKKHMREAHSGERPYTCTYCMKHFTIRKILLRHRRLSHKVFQDIYFCGICRNNNVGFINSDYLTKHIKKYHMNAKTDDNISDLLEENNGDISDLSEFITIPKVSNEQITLNDDGTINIQINDKELDEQCLLIDRSLVVDDDVHKDSSVKEEDDARIGEINDENTIDLEQTIDYTYAELEDENVAENNADIIYTDETIDENNFINGELIQFDQENQQYIIYSRYNINDDANLVENGDALYIQGQNVTDNSENSYNEKYLQNAECGLEKNEEASKSLEALKNLEAKAVESSEEIKDGMVRVTRNNDTGYVCHVKTDLIFDETDYTGPVTFKKPSAEQRYKCPKCDEIFTRQYSLTRHLGHTHNEYCLVCNTCGTSFNRVHLLEAHRKVHMDSKNNSHLNTSDMQDSDGYDQILSNLREDISESKFETHTAVQRITDTDSESKTNKIFNCDICEKTFQRRVNLERHRAQHMSIAHVSYVCSICDKFFSNSLQLYKHKRQHKEEHLLCNLCDRAFTTIGGLKYHLKTHTGAKHHGCPFCGKKFTANINLNAHIKTVHSEVKPHLCNICGNRYTTADHLRKHMTSHTGERRFLCNTCGRSFSQSSHLTQHSWIHSGIKPFPCNLCNNKYTSTSALKKHIKNNHENKISK